MGFQANAAEISTNTAQMQAMDKITGRVSVINVPVNSEVKFGSFSIVVRDCKTRSPEETPENFAFVDVVDTNTNSEQVNIFRGWMLSSTPALNAIEHPVYDVWLLKCIDTDISKTPKLSNEELAARDDIPQQLVIKTSAPVIEDEFAQNNPSGEPINLLPVGIRQAGEEKMVEEQGIKLQPIETEETEVSNFADEWSEEQDQDAHEPQSLLNIGKNKDKKLDSSEAKEETVKTPEELQQNAPLPANILPPSENPAGEHVGLPPISETAIPGYVELSEEIQTENSKDAADENTKIEQQPAAQPVEETHEIEEELPKLVSEPQQMQLPREQDKVNTPTEIIPAEDNVFETEGNYVFEEKQPAPMQIPAVQPQEEAAPSKVPAEVINTPKQGNIEGKDRPVISEDILKELEEELAESLSSDQQ